MSDGVVEAVPSAPKAKEPVGIHSYLRFHKKLPHVWCRGCGNGIVTGALVRAIDSLKLDRNKVILVSGIGCSSRAPVYLDFNTLHTTHGRAFAFASGLKMARPDLTLIVITGDGDATAIGGNHFIHTCRRNIDLTIVVFNNNIYGMTGGQTSPTTPFGAMSTTAPYRNIDHPFDICRLAVSAGATYAARETSFHAKKLELLIRDGIVHKGTSVIEAIAACTTIYGKLNKMGTPVDMLRWQKEQTVPYKPGESTGMEDAVISEEEASAKITTGVFVNRSAPEYVEEYDKLLSRLAAPKGPAA